MKYSRDFIKRRFYDFRNGHGAYLAYFIAFMQFMIISYQLYIEQTPLLKSIFPNIAIWLAFFVCTYVPAAIYVGHRVHLKSQYQNEVKQLTDKNPFTYETQPGKEQDYQLPANLTSYEMTLRGMEMNNQNAIIWEKILPVINPKLAGIIFPKWNDVDFAKVRYWYDVTRRLQKGESITEIMKST